MVSPANAQAAETIDAWPEWRDGGLVLCGPEASGKTHLASAWARRAGALVLQPGVDLATLKDRPLLIEAADTWPDPESLFHLLNRAVTGQSLLLTSRLRPTAWNADLPDLRSRLNALFVVEISEPDDALLEGLMLKLFRERHIRPADDVLPYLLRRMERSAPAARALVDRIDEAASAEGRAISRVLVRQILEIEAETPDLFE